MLKIIDTEFYGVSLSIIKRETMMPHLRPILTSRKFNILRKLHIVLKNQYELKKELKLKTFFQDSILKPLQKHMT